MGDDEVSKRKFSPAELAEFFNACIILSRPELPGEQLDIMAASDTLSKIIRGIDLEHNGSVIAMLQSIKLADTQGKIINAPNVNTTFEESFTDYRSKYSQQARYWQTFFMEYKCCHEQIKQRFMDFTTP